VTITPEQCRAAREMLKWSRDRLSTVRLASFENETAVLTREELVRITKVLEQAGIELSSLDAEALKRKRS